jgi:hypothetical protein
MRGPLLVTRDLATVANSRTGLMETGFDLSCDAADYALTPTVPQRKT